MAGLWWMDVTLVFFLSVGSLDAVDPVDPVDQNKLAELIQKVKNRYKIQGMFSLALSIKNEDPENVNELLAMNPKYQVEQQISNGNVYTSQRLAVAKVKQPEHAEFRVLQNLQLARDDGDLLVIYSYASSCPGTCTNKKNKYNIIDLIKKVIKNGKWKRRVFVFEKVFKPKDGPSFDKDELTKAIEELATSGIPLENIFRCYKPKFFNFECTSCSSGGKVANECIDDNL